MFSSTVLAAIFILSPILVAPASVSDVTDTPKYYLLKTKVYHGGRSKFNNLYVSSYHTGAGLNDAVLELSKDVARKAYLNGTNQLFEGSGFPYGFVMQYQDYTKWAPVFINAGEGNAGFYFNNTDRSGLKGLKWDSSAGSGYNEFEGWLACDWVCTMRA
jgi:hypothetical protein